ncbi:transforming acidic coiled-coil-containing protein 3-like [Mercenaria mercenaria]|uniref:transforming acidic coiled-coil-containing protein 3-like n=1 Tax=Mercenaria mercenaria TaxID=6596 RepID=UPI00234F05F4|nr:transforming acidic coiled-coil-containing protein 3-like [Mercenaria mercenaria]
MADDLMDFTEAENGENSLVVEQDENDIPVVPGLVQSPVIVNSILKQSNKDNLIQLYTPVQKPEKGRLKVHFGHDSLLQTPNVKQVKKKMDVVTPIKEESENSAKGVKFDVEDKENMSGKTSHTDVTKKAESAEIGGEIAKDTGVEVAKEIVNQVIDQIPIKDDVDSSRNSADSGIDESAMEVSICEPQTFEEPSDSGLDHTNDILRQAELLLKSLQGGSVSTDTVAEEPSNTAPAPDEGIEEKVDADVKIEKQTSEAASGPESQTDKEETRNVAETGGSVVDSKSSETEKPEMESNKNEFAKAEVVSEKEEKQEVSVAASTEEEPMECEEAMEVDDEDDEIVFNIGKSKNIDTVNIVCEEEVVNKSCGVLEERNIEDNKISEIENEENVATVENTDNELTIKAISENNGETEKVENTESVLNKENSAEDKNEDSCVTKEVDSKEQIKSDKEKCVDECEKIAGVVVEQPAPDAQKSADVLKDNPEINSEKRTVSKKTKDDSSDEEFMSADEDMEVDEVKTPAKSLVDTNTQQDSETNLKEESPERIPPKVGYNLNFDDLDAMNPFATKKSLLNSPDVGKEVVKKKTENVVKVDESKVESVDVVLETDDKSDKNDQYKSANTSPVKSEPPKAEIILSPNAALVDEVCRDKTAGDIFEERPDCLLQDDGKESSNTESLNEKDKSVSDTISESLGSGTKKELDFDNIDPFKPKTQIVNTPDKAKQEEKTEIELEDPFKPSKQIKNTPDKADIKDQVIDTQTKTNNIAKVENVASEEKQNLEQPRTDIEIPLTPQKEVAETNDQPAASPEIPVTRGAYDLDALNLDDIDPFKPSKQMGNSPCAITSSSKPAEIDPFKPKKQIQNSPVASKENTKTVNEEIDPFKPKTQIMNSPDSKKGVQEISDSSKVDVETTKPVVEEKTGEEIVPLETLDDIEDPFKTKSQIVNSPVKEKEDTKEIENDPFKPKTRIQNSPAKADAEDTLGNFESLDIIDPFKPKKQMQNSPAGKTSDIDMVGLDSASLDSLDPFKSNSKVQNSPSGKEKEAIAEILDLELIDDPFKPSIQMQNSPALKDSKSRVKGTESEKTEVSGSKADKTLTDDNIDPFADVDPFKSKKQLAMSPSVKSDSMIDPFADLNPFQTKCKVANSPEKTESAIAEKGLDDLSNTDPFKSKSKIANSPGLQTIEENPFVSKSRIVNTPTKEDDPFAQKTEIPTTPPNEPVEQVDGLGDIFEVQGVTRRGQEGSQLEKFGDIDESQFVSASQVFNDPAAWEMLEKLGGTTTDSGAESALSRMSLYVKFDPLVDEAPINPRRISIRVSQLEKVKEYGLDETLLLLGTPPKKRRQSLARTTPSGLKSAPGAGPQPPSKKTEPVGVTPGAVDLILAYSPKEKEQQEKSGNKPDGPIMKLLDDVDSTEESENLFQELKYTDADLKRFQRDNKLAMQGMLINKDKEWCKKEKQWEQEKSELIKKCKQIKQDRDKLEQAFLTLEQTVYQIAAARDAADKKVLEVTGEKEQALQDIQAVETAFSDLHRRYEKAKTMIISMKKNEETLKKHTAESQEKQKKLNEKLHALEKSAQEKLSANKQEIEKLEQQRDSVQSKFDAQMKISNMKIENLETTLQRKTEENKQLTEICDNLLAKVGQ